MIFGFCYWLLCYLLQQYLCCSTHPFTLVLLFIRRSLLTHLNTTPNTPISTADKEVEYAKQAHMRTKEIKALRERYFPFLYLFVSFHLWRNQSANYWLCRTEKWLPVFAANLFHLNFNFVCISQSDSFCVVSLNRVEQLEKQQSENLERFKVRTKELKTSVSKELQEATLDAAGN